MTVERVSAKSGATWRLSAVLGVAFALGGCSFASDKLFPDFLGGSSSEESAGETAMTAAPAPTMDVTAADMTPLPSSTKSYVGTTVVGQRVAQFRSEYESARNSASLHTQQFNTVRALTIANAAAYNGAVGAIRARLQIGTTPGNPELLAQWQEAQSRLTSCDGDLANMNQLSAQVASDAGSVSYLLDNVRAAFTLSGAIDEDHRQLRALEDELQQTNIVIDRLLQSLATDIARQQQFVTNERNGLVDLAGGINVGGMYSVAGGRSMAAAPRQMAAASAPMSFADRKPLVVIRFDKPDVAFEPALYQALSRALERRPDAVFDLVAVSSGANSTAARRSAENVMKSMTSMGLPSDRVVMASMSSATASSPEVHVYVR